ncbi:MAG TPA: serine/threonine-protein kinase [Polyangia bacterium]|nr:serine/threonine-protein kinase [Polyangia bacterium]
MPVDPPAPPDPRVGHVLQGRYRILAKIASGAMGVVYRGERVQLGRPVAVKFLHPWIAAQKAFLGRFENEAKAMSRLAHPHCVSVIDFGVEGAPYLVMDFVTGRTVRELMHEGPIPLARAMRIAQQLLAGLAHAHAQGIVHRDLKPENLILTAEDGLQDHLRILDFGLAKLRDGPVMTAGLAVGTPSYMSPEQSGGAGTVDARSDLYAVAVLLFEILAGRKPFQSENVGELIFMHRERPPPRLREAAPAAGYSAALEAILDKALSKMPEDRFASAAELAAALAATPEGQGRPPPAATRKAPAPAKTTVDTVSAVRRRLGAEIPGTRAPSDAAATTWGARQWRQLGIGFGLLLVVLVGLSIGRTLRYRSGSATAPAASAPVSSPAMAPAARAPAAPPPAAPAPASLPAPAAEDPRIEQARQMLAATQTADAVALLERVRAEKPDDADAPYLLAMIDFEAHRWPEGLANAQTAVRANPAFRSDGDLIRGVIRSLASDHGYERSQSFLRGLGPAATPYLKEAAGRDPNARVRERAAELLGRGGDRRQRWGGASSAGTRSSPGLTFKR